MPSLLPPDLPEHLNSGDEEWRGGCGAGGVATAISQSAKQQDTLPLIQTLNTCRDSSLWPNDQGTILATCSNLVERPGIRE